MYQQPCPFCGTQGLHSRECPCEPIAVRLESIGRALALVAGNDPEADSDYAVCLLRQDASRLQGSLQALLQGGSR